MIASREVIRQLERQRRTLGMSCAVLARRSGVSLRTVQRVLSETSEVAEFATVMAIAGALGATLRLDFRSADALKRAQATRKSRRLVSLTQGTSALEAQGVPAATLKSLEKRTAWTLLAGSPRRLWAE